MRTRTTKRAFIGAVACAAALTLAAGLASAEEITREQYKASVEPICKANSEANEHILKGVQAKVKAGKLKPAGRQFTRAATALKRTLGQIRAKPEPPADEEKLGEWQKRISGEANLLQRVGKALIEEKRHRAEVLSVRLVSDARLTNALVVSFGFNHCRFEPSKYT